MTGTEKEAIGMLEQEQRAEVLGRLHALNFTWLTLSLQEISTRLGAVKERAQDTAWGLVLRGVGIGVIIGMILSKLGGW